MIYDLGPLFLAKLATLGDDALRQLPRFRLRQDYGGQAARNDGSCHHPLP
jgi:hypothetical protein